MADDTLQPREKSNFRLWVTVISVALAAIFVAINSQKVTIDFLVGQTKISLVFALLLSTLFGFVIGWLAAHLRRRD